jgi:1-phosphatidylinositol phosphodiesterase
MWMSAAIHTIMFALLSCFLLFFVSVTNADRTGAYRNSPFAAEDNSDWMSELPDDAVLGSLSLPGTHDSGAYNFGGPAVETQSMNIDQQLKAGIRALDIRLGRSNLNLGTECNGPDLWTFHGITCQFEKFSDILTTVEAFLNDHPDETIVMRVKRENGSIPNFASVVEAEMDAFEDLFYNGGSTNLILNQVRGFVVLLRDYDGSTRGISWQTLDIQDQYRISSNWALANKWNAVRNHFIDTDNISVDLSVNFLSASGGSFPYFVASGKSSWETYAPALLTGWTDASFWPFNTCDQNNACIVEYYRTNCSWKVCSVAFKGTNLMAREFIESTVRLKTGIVMSDFPGPSLISAIIDTNTFI